MEPLRELGRDIETVPAEQVRYACTKLGSGSGCNCTAWSSRRHHMMCYLLAGPEPTFAFEVYRPPSRQERMTQQTYPSPSYSPAPNAPPNAQVRAVGVQDFKAALQSIKPSVSRDQLRRFEQWTADFGTPS